MAKAERSPIYTAEKDIYTHPIAEIFSRSYLKISELNQRFSSINYADQDIKKEAREAYGFLTDEMVNTKPFTLDPSEIVTIWSEIIKTIPNKNLLDFFIGPPLMSALISAYTVQDIDSSTWKNFPHYAFIGNDLPPEILEDKNRLIQINERFENFHKIFTRSSQFRESTQLMSTIRHCFGNGFMGTWSKINYQLKK